MKPLLVAAVLAAFLLLGINGRARAAAPTCDNERAVIQMVKQQNPMDEVTVETATGPAAQQFVQMTAKNAAKLTGIDEVMVFRFRNHPAHAFVVLMRDGCASAYGGAPAALVESALGMGS